MTAPLAAFLRRMGCSVEVLGPGLVDATVERLDEFTSTLSRSNVELDAYLRVWAATQPEAPAELLFREPRTS